jgi:hypothetical protein
MGCGAWKCPPDHVAEIIAGVVARCAANGAFRRVDFAVLRATADGYSTKDHRTKADGRLDNFDEFVRVFAGIQKEEATAGSVEIPTIV